jgi:cyclic-di-GMP-binding protein
VMFNFKLLLSLSTIEARALTAGEFDWASDYLLRIAGLLDVKFERPTALTDALYWLDLDHPAEPRSCTRYAPPTEGVLLYIDTSPLAQRAAETLARHESGATTPELETAENDYGVRGPSLLARLEQQWRGAARRKLPRRKQSYSVQACAGLSSIWQAIARSHAKETGLVSEWEVINESPGGFSILHVRGVGGGLSAGMALALRSQEEDPWSLCVVRWLKSDAPDEIEMGLQLVSTGAVPVQVGFRNPHRTPTMSKALVLPVLPALRHHQAILAPSGTYTARRFSLISQVDRLYVAQARLLSLDMQTANIELFQFEVDPYPV